MSDGATVTQIAQLILGPVGLGVLAKIGHATIIERREERAARERRQKAAAVERKEKRESARAERREERQERVALLERISQLATAVEDHTRACTEAFHKIEDLVEEIRHVRRDSGEHVREAS